MHVDCSDGCDWRELATAPPPPPPPRIAPAELAARARLDAYKPGFFDELFGGATRRRAVLEGEVQQASALDQQQHELAMIEHRRKFEQWSYQVKLAHGVLTNDVEAFRAALSYLGAFDELERFDDQVTLDSAVRGTVAFTCVIQDTELVPSEELKVSSSGKLSTKDMAAGKYWALFQDHVASCALRIAREAYAILPVERVIVNVRISRLDSSTGHLVAMPVLAFHATRDILARLNFKALDPSDALENFPHRMKLKKTTGFEPVEVMTADDQWITT
ncbi:MAG TPA: hypothetical protein VGC42_15180 [Kofleriaceae bacterium]